MKKIFVPIAIMPLFMFLGFLFTGTVPQAQALSVTPALENPIKYSNFSDFVAGVTQTAVKVLLPFVVLAFIYSGFLFVKAQGNEEELVEAKKAIKWSIVGAFILFGAWGFAEIIKTTISTITS